MRLPSRPGTLDPELDARLVERCLAGDARAWDALVRRYERLVLSVGRSYRLSDEDLGDVFQEVFTALLKGLPRLRDPRSLCRWISSTTDRIARTVALRSRREQARSVSVEDDTRTASELTSEEAAIGADLERLETMALVQLALGAISDRCRKLLHALYHEEPVPSYSELSTRLGVPIGSLGPTRARCLDRLRANLTAIDPEGFGISEAPPPTSPTERSRSQRPNPGREAGPSRASKEGT